MEISCDILSSHNVDNAEAMARTDLPSPSLDLPHVAPIKHNLQYLSQDDDYGPDGYGPQFIAQETEIVAAEPQIKLENGILGDIGDYGGSGLEGDPSQAVTSIQGQGVSSTCSRVHQELAEDMATVTSAGTKSNTVVLQTHAPNDVNVPATFLNGNDHITSNISLVPVTAAVLLNSGHLQLIARLKESSAAVPTPGILSQASGLQPGSSRVLSQMDPDWSRSDIKKAKDRAKKRQQRSDPSYKQKEREKSVQRMRMRRQDPVYRSIERVKDRIRRKVSRQENPEKRQAEKDRDKISKRIHRSRMNVMSSPGSTHLLGAPLLGETLTEVTDGALIHLNGEVIVETNPYHADTSSYQTDPSSYQTDPSSYQEDSRQVAEVYREMVVKSEHLQCRDQDVAEHVVYTDDYPS